MHDIRIIVTGEDETGAAHVAARLVNFIKGLIGDFRAYTGVAPSLR
jgi:hypothetical protein